MRIRWKISILVAALFAVLAISEIHVAKDVLMPSFTELEQREAEVAMRRIDLTLKRTFEQLLQAATSWGNWADTYRFVQDRNGHFMEVNFTPTGLKELLADVAVVEDLNGQVVAAAAFDLHTGWPLDLNLLRLRTLAFPSHEDSLNGRPTTGLLQTERGVLLLAASPILDGLGRGTPRGSVVLGRLLSKEEVARMGALAQADFSISAARPGPSWQIEQTAEVTRVSRTLKDITDRPIITMAVALPRKISARGQSAVHYASLYLMGTAVLVVTLLAVVLNKMVLDPLARMTRHAVEMGRNEDLTTRLDFDRHDEIGVLAREFDRMVGRVAESRSQLVDQAYRAGFAELAKGVLHNLGNAMTPIGVRLAILRTRLNSICTEDLTLAVRELARGDADGQRRTDLEEFVRLTCMQLASSLASAAQDVEIMTRQAALVQTALTEQIRSTGNEHVVESVRLPDLLAHSLDVVPDWARQRLDIHADPALEALGALQIPRTVLHLVLQNFVINAAEAIREAGRSKGVLLVKAEVLIRGEARQLVICCSDNGVGIAPHNLQRIFEKGFSTKSHETNFGIGLHWCANAVGALGGRVWATSAGTGHGATLHVMVPLSAVQGSTLTRAA